MDVDEEAAAMYRSLPGPLGDRLRQVLTEDNAMILESGRCPMWRADGLCRIQAELGHESLCQTCRDFPRLKHDYGDFTEQMLELSCPEAARLIFSEPDDWNQIEQAGSEEPDYDQELMAILKQSRDNILYFLKNNSLPLNKKLAVLLLYAHTAQGAIDGDGSLELDPDECLTLAKKFAAQGDLASIVSFFEELELLTDRWPKLLKTAKKQPVADSLLPLALYMVRRYWLQAVSDYDLVGRAKLIVTACILVAALGGTREAAQLFSKEIENDPDNVEALLDAAYTEQAFTDANLLGILSQFAM